MKKEILSKTITINTGMNKMNNNSIIVRLVLIIGLSCSSYTIFAQDLGGLGGGDDGSGNTGNDCGLPLESGNDVENGVEGAKIVCLGDELAFYAASSQSSYSWQVIDATEICSSGNKVQVRFDEVGVAKVRLNGSGMNVTVHSLLTSGGTITLPNNNDICSGASPGTINNGSTPSDGSGSFSYQWYKKTEDDSDWIKIDGAGGSSYTSYSPGTLTKTTSFKRDVKDTRCIDTKSSNTITVTVIEDFDDGGSISGEKTICYNGNVGLLDNVSYPSGGPAIPLYQWQKKVGSNSWENIDGAESSTLAPGNLTQTTSFKRIAKDAINCAFDESNTITITVRSELSAGEINGARTLEFGATIGNIGSNSAAVGGSGNYTYQWERRLEGGDFMPIAGASAQTYQSGNALVGDTYFRRKVIDSDCGEEYSNTIKITLEVDPITGLPANIGCQPEDISSPGSAIFGCTQACRDGENPILYPYA
ncbi:MAG: hypothetical protein AAFN93_12670, partial [Bacteroidota bacterium]